MSLAFRSLNRSTQIIISYLGEREPSNIRKIVGVMREILGCPLAFSDSTTSYVCIFDKVNWRYLTAVMVHQAFKYEEIISVYLNDVSKSTCNCIGKVSFRFFSEVTPYEDDYNSSSYNGKSYINRIDSHKRDRYYGVGTALMQGVVDLSIVRGFAYKIIFYADTPDFYYKLGFKYINNSARDALLEKRIAKKQEVPVEFRGLMQFPLA